MTTPDLTRRKDLARIHLSKKELGLDDDTYRALLQGLTKKTSAADLNAKERWEVLQEMARLGSPATSQKKPYPGRPVIVRADRADLLRKIEAQLSEAKRPWAYVHAMAWRMFKRTQVQDCEPDELRRIVAALSYDAKRHGRMAP